MKTKQKEHIRSKFTKKRENLDKEETDIRSRQIVYAFLEEFDISGKKILTYLTQETSNEVDTWPLVTELFNSKTTEVYVPVFDMEENEITPKKVDDDTKFYNDQFGIPTPKVGKKKKDSNVSIDSDVEFDYIIVPLIAFDLKGNRIGHGNGTYDRFLKSETVRNAKKIGFAYQVQLTKKPIPVSINDVKLDYCITEEKIYRFGS